MMKNKKQNSGEIKRFFIGIAILCFFLALIILAMMLQASFVGDVVSSGSEVVVINSTHIQDLSADVSQGKYIKENFFKHFMRGVLTSFEGYIQF